MLPVRFNYADVKPISIENKTGLKKFIIHIFEEEVRLLKRVDYIFCSDPYLFDINIKFLKHNTLTDIISFELGDKYATVGEIYISVDRVRENAIIHSTSFQREMFRVIFHGALHLCGYRDKKKSEIRLMREKEDYYLQQYFQKFR